MNHNIRLRKGLGKALVFIQAFGCLYFQLGNEEDVCDKYSRLESSLGIFKDERVFATRKEKILMFMHYLK